MKLQLRDLGSRVLGCRVQGLGFRVLGFSVVLPLHFVGSGISNSRLATFPLPWLLQTLNPRTKTLESRERPRAVKQQSPVVNGVLGTLSFTVDVIVLDICILALHFCGA